MLGGARAGAGGVAATAWVTPWPHPSISPSIHPSIYPSIACGRCSGRFSLGCGFCDVALQHLNFKNPHQIFSEDSRVSVQFGGNFSLSRVFKEKGPRGKMVFYGAIFSVATGGRLHKGKQNCGREPHLCPLPHAPAHACTHVHTGTHGRVNRSSLNFNNVEVNRS